MTPVDPATIELGLDTFGDVTRDESGEWVSGAQTIRDVVDQAVLADQVGLAYFGVGEHHRREFAISSPELYDLMTQQLGWSAAHHQRWLADTAAHDLLGHA